MHIGYKQRGESPVTVSNKTTRLDTGGVKKVTGPTKIVELILSANESMIVRQNILHDRKIAGQKRSQDKNRLWDHNVRKARVDLGSESLIGPVKIVVPKLSSREKLPL